MNLEIPPHHTKFDLGSIAVIVLSAIGVMPGVAALLAAIWYSILIYDRIRSGRKI